ncbi:hypothetical protein BDV27DRAFT_139232 [Aspergillus caelatus]|uniref:Nephrocystin 3-like N-terminal domain-containing protein n=1 Tax=Aspergillus caelatus TaxID=61420 RepID=A0A5N6ZIR5_9EURO|nr:uncharacterized protein BDV27DRAFT_139232 [Aspergillus caelatus]KAE8357501.1 hypothetical protein BDV27DRAFT_139232 [Aspergillus caelatus]
MDWKIRKSPGFLWVHRIPGCGKSVLASSLIDTLQPDVFYFFCNRIHPDKRSPSSILGSLVSQILGSATLKANPSVLDNVVNNIWEVCEMYPDMNKTSVDTLWIIFEALSTIYKQE